MLDQVRAQQVSQAGREGSAWRAPIRTVTNCRKRKRAAADLLNWISVHYCIIVLESATYAPKKEEGQEEEEG